MNVWITRELEEAGSLKGFVYKLWANEPHFNATWTSPLGWSEMTSDMGEPFRGFRLHKILNLSELVFPESGILKGSFNFEVENG